MNIQLIDIDSKIPNFALMKISAYHKEKGDYVSLKYIENPDMVYISVIFKKNKKTAVSCAYNYKCLYPDIKIDIGGPGYDLYKKLPDEIENHEPDYDLYPGIDYSIGFTTRGCIRNCPFCIVPLKEGSLKKVSNIKAIHNPKFDKIKLLDNNILANKANFVEVANYCIDNNLKLDISQGLDARLLTKESAQLLSKIEPITTFCFAFDSLAYKPHVIRCIELLKDAGIDVRHKVQFYVYCDNSIIGEYGFNSALKRCKILKEHGTNPYVMLNIDREPTKAMKHLKRWANRKAIFWSCDFEDYLKKELVINGNLKMLSIFDFCTE